MLYLGGDEGWEVNSLALDRPTLDEPPTRPRILSKASRGVGGWAVVVKRHSRLPLWSKP